MTETVPSPRRVSRRIASIAESATLAVDSKAKAMRAEGRPVIGFGAGEPDFATPRFIVEAAMTACADPSSHRYTPAAGLPALRAAIASKTLRDSGWHVDPSQVLVTNGGKQAVFQSFATIVDTEDEIILPAPYWTTYPEAIRLAGGIPVTVLSDESTGYLPTVAELDAAVTARTKAVVICSPSNPTGAVYPADLLTDIAHWAIQRDLWIITDEIYEHLTYGVESASIPTLVPEAASRCIVMNGVAKTYAMTGWRVGWMIGPPDVIQAATNLQSHLTSNVANVSQLAAVAALTGSLDVVAEMRASFDSRRLLIVDRLNAMPGITCPTPGGAFYVFPSVTRLLGSRIAGRQVNTSSDVADLFLDEAEVAVVPGEAFGAPGYVRLSYALNHESITEGMDRLDKLLLRLA